MSEFHGIGKLLIVLGLGLAAAGLVLSLLGTWPGAGWPGRLPGDLVFTRGRVTVYVPLGVCIIVSVAGSLLLYYIMKR